MATPAMQSGATENCMLHVLFSSTNRTASATATAWTSPSELLEGRIFDFQPPLPLYRGHQPRCQPGLPCLRSECVTQIRPSKANTEGRIALSRCLALETITFPLSNHQQAAWSETWSLFGRGLHDGRGRKTMEA
jgi:hypothetical protein